MSIDSVQSLGVANTYEKRHAECPTQSDVVSVSKNSTSILSTTGKEYWKFICDHQSMDCLFGLPQYIHGYQAQLQMKETHYLEVKILS